MSREQHNDYHIAGILLSMLFIVSVFGALIFSSLLLVIQADKSRRQRHAARARRLHNYKTGNEVSAPSLNKNDDQHLYWHIFLSHTWQQVNQPAHLALPHQPHRPQVPLCPPQGQPSHTPMCIPMHMRPCTCAHAHAPLRMHPCKSTHTYCRASRRCAS